MILSAQEKKEWLQLAFSENVGPMTFRNLVAYFGSAKEAMAHVNEFARRGGRTKPVILASEKQVMEQVKQAEQTDTTILPSCDPDYPKLLGKIEDAPVVLFVRGHIGLCNKPSVGMVGTRNASLNGRSFVRKLSNDLCKRDYTVVSGMARGIDTAAHEGALANTDGKGGTVAVIGTSLNEIYPQENERLFHEICTRGCVLTELPFGTPTSPQNFPRRNRIISGLSKGIVVIEAQGRSGSLITARLALEQGREVFAVPGFPLEPRSEGPNRLLKQGATLVENINDITAVLEDLTTGYLFQEPAFEIINPPLSRISDDDLAIARKLIMENLTSETTGIDELIRGTELTTQLVNIILVELELAGRIERHPGNRVSLLYSTKE